MKTISVTDKLTANDLLKQGYDDDVEWYQREHDPTFIESIARARKQAAEGRTITYEELKRRLGVE
jgi:hypothetical protein